MSDVLKRLGVAECSEGGSRCRCVEPITWTGRSRGAIAVCGRCGDEWTDTVVDLYWQQQALIEQREQRTAVS